MSHVRQSHTARCSTAFCWYAILVVVILVSATPAQTVKAPAETDDQVYADERETAFFEGLKKRGFDDLMEHYLAVMADSSVVSDVWKSRILFERSAILIALAETNPTSDVAKRLEEIKRLMGDFVKTHPGVPEAEDAKLELAKIRLAEARREVAAAAQSEQDNDKTRLLAAANTSFNAAKRQFQTINNSLNAQLKQFASGEVDTPQADVLDGLRRDAMAAELTIALIEYERAEIFAADTQQHQKQLQVALKEFAELAKDHRGRLLGLEAIYYQGVCHQDLGDPEAALEYFEELLRIDSLPGSLVARALARSLDCMCHESVQTPQQGIATAERWLARRSSDVPAVDLAAVQLALAKSYVQEGTTLDSRKQQRNQELARQQLLAAARVPGPHQATARQLLASLPAPSAASANKGSGMEGKEPSADFVAAKAAADAVREQLQSTITLLELQQRNLETADDAARRAEAKKLVEETASNLERFEISALEHYRRALAAVDETVSDDSLNETRYLIAFLKYRQQRFFEAAAVAGFVAQRYPATEVARKCAEIAMASYWQLFQSASGNDQSFETAQLIRIADMVAEQWPNDPAANDALINLVSLMVQKGDVAKAEKYLQRIPENSPARADAELRTGVALWQKWLITSHENAADDTARSVVDERWKIRAEELLTQGLDRAQGQPVDIVMANAAIAKAQLFLESNQPDKAIALLNDDQIGPKRLVDQRHPLTKTPLFVEQTYRTLVKALVAKLADSASDEQVIGQIQDAMDRLQSALSDDGDQQRLIAIYVDLTKDLRRHIDAAAENEKAKLVRGFELLLLRVSESAKSLSVRNWIAETYAEMASSLPQSSEGLSDEAKRFYNEAEELYVAILNDAAADPALTENVVMQMQTRIANINRQLGKYKEAIDWFEKVLNQRNNLISVQIDAAETYQEAGKSGSNNLYELAIKGARPDPNGVNSIWGWERLSKVTATQMQRDESSRERFAEVFFRARFNIARCRALQAERSTGDERTRFVAAARRAIKITEGLYPDLGGPQWQAQFADLLRQLEEI